MSHPDCIAQIALFRFDVELGSRFTVASGALEVVQGACVRVRLASGHEGWGELSPFPAITGETRDSTLAAAREAAGTLQGERVSEYRRLFNALGDWADQPAARCGLETALLDAFCRLHGLPLWAHFGGAERSREHVTDITIPVTDPEATVEWGRLWHGRGFRRFKLKVGVDADSEIEKLRRVAAACPAAQFILDANGGFALDDARRFLAGVRQTEVLLLEQPLPADDVDGARALRAEFGVRVAADESAKSAADVVRLAADRAADVINLKIMKSGVREAIRMALVARSLGLSLMIGGMVETRLAMGCSFALAVGLGDFEFLDLDTPLLLRTDPWAGGFRYDGPRMIPSEDPGLGMQPVSPDVFSACVSEGESQA